MARSEERSVRLRLSAVVRLLSVLTRWKRRYTQGGTLAVTLTVVLLSAAANSAMGATIYVTTPFQKISSSGGCSLQEAIYSANFDDNVAISSLNTNTGKDVLVRTECIPGSGNDTIVLPRGGIVVLEDIVRGGIETNHTGRTATPLITTNITIRADGALLVWVGDDKGARLFSVGRDGNLTIHDAYISGFIAKGGDGGGDGGGGLGAGGAIYVDDLGVLTIEGSTFERNGAIGGNGSGLFPSSGGGGGMGGNGGRGGASGGGGGGSLGDGGEGLFFPGGGGGTYEDGDFGFGNHAKGGLFCGGDAGQANGSIGDPTDGADGSCVGGGGGGGGSSSGGIFGSPGSGGNGNYGGGGGGGGSGDGNGGSGGFGGGGGAAGVSGSGGDGGFGGGGGAFYHDGHPGHSLRYGGRGEISAGGGGGALGGAIFNLGTVTVRNSTFTRNFAVEGTRELHSPGTALTQAGRSFR